MNIYPTQETWDQFNQSLSNALGIDYIPCPMPLDQHEPTNHPIPAGTLKPFGYSITEPNGNTLVCNNLSEYCRTNGLRYSKMRDVSKGIKKQYKGFKCHVIGETIENHIKSNGMKRYVFTDESGNTYKVLGLSAFCREKGLHVPTMSEIANGRRGICQHKGWTCRSIT